jgi:hypothetical protein
MSSPGIGPTGPEQPETVKPEKGEGKTHHKKEDIGPMGPHLSKSDIGPPGPHPKSNIGPTGPENP